MTKWEVTLLVTCVVCGWFDRVCLIRCRTLVTCAVAFAVAMCRLVSLEIVRSLVSIGLLVCPVIGCDLLASSVLSKEVVLVSSMLLVVIALLVWMWMMLFVVRVVVGILRVLLLVLTWCVILGRVCVSMLIVVPVCICVVCLRRCAVSSRKMNTMVELKQMVGLLCRALMKSVIQVSSMAIDIRKLTLRWC